jgi:predicted dehydrogenase
MINIDPNFAEIDPDNPPLRVAVAGCGGIGWVHLEKFLSMPKLFDVIAIAESNEERLRLTAGRFGIRRAYTDYDELCRFADVEVISLATPPFLHFEQIAQGLQRGKHVICEKPLVGTVAEVDELAALERASGKRVMPIFNYRFGHGLQKLKFLRDQNLTGRAYLTTVETAWRRRPEYYAVPWRGKLATELGGTVLSHASHAHDMLTYILGPVKNVFAHTKTLVNAIEVEDCAAISLEMADGSLAALSVTMGSTAEISRHRFCFANLTAESNTRPYDNSGDPWLFTPDNSGAADAINAALANFEPQPEGFAGQFVRFYQALQNGTLLPVTLADARASLQLVEAIYTSAYSGQPVKLSE